MNKKLLVLLLVIVVIYYYLNQEEKPKEKKPKPNLISDEPWIIPQIPSQGSNSLMVNSPNSKSQAVAPINEPLIQWPSDEPLEIDYSWLTDDNLEFILKNWTPLQEALTKANQTSQKFSLRTDIANIYNCFYKALSNQDWDLPEFLERLEDNKHTYTLFPLRVNGNHWGLFILHNLTWLELEANYQVYYTSSGGGDLEQEKKQLEPFIEQIVGESIPIEIISPKDRNSKGYECGVYLCFYVREILERGELRLEKTYTSAECQAFRREWKERIGESWGRW